LRCAFAQQRNATSATLLRFTRPGVAPARKRDGAVLTFDQIDAVARAFRGDPAARRLAEHDAAKTRSWLVERIARDPLARRYVRHLDNRAGARNGEPWHAMGERLYAALLLSQVFAEPSVRLGTSFGDQADEAMAVGLASMVFLTAVPYLWTEQVEDLVRASPAVPPHTVRRDLLPYPTVFFSYEVAYHAVVNGRDVDIDWCVLTHRPEGVQMLIPTVVPRSAGGDGSVTFETAAIPYGKRWPEDFNHGTDGTTAAALSAHPERFTRGANAGVELILKRLAFINSPYTQTQTRRLPREIRREYARVKDPARPQHEPVCHVVVLRRAVQSRDQARDEAEREGRDWQHHWWVSGHYRAQWHPSTKSHRVIWIAPHVKGPLDKPLLDKTYAVVR